MIVEAAKAWIGTPWRHQARIKGVGVDCAMLIAEVFEECGLIQRFECGPYPIDVMHHSGFELFLSHLDKHAVRVEDPEPGDVVVWRFGRQYSHGGIVVDWPMVIHASRPDGCVCWGDATQGRLQGRDHVFYRAVK